MEVINESKFNDDFDLALFISDDRCSVEDDGDQEGLDLYTDLLTTEFHENKLNNEKVFEDYQKLEAENLKLQDQLKAINSNLEILKKQNIKLKYNISSLYKTAKEEIDRKDLYIQELRESLDRMIFRRRQFSEKSSVSENCENNCRDVRKDTTNKKSVDNRSYVSNDINNNTKSVKKLSNHSKIKHDQYDKVGCHSNLKNSDYGVLQSSKETSNCLRSNDKDSKSFQKERETSHHLHLRYKEKDKSHHKHREDRSRRSKSNERFHHRHMTDTKSKNVYQDYKEEHSNKEKKLRMI
ncbi:uncharacterized protein MAL13P1.304-like [Centruroides sculpturatus]|uniref:uncharacterized protein MAL13P1.304-like n=1 Tax=Centruroides sculpturatus TaxID=218467 RepID=UPI000C6D95CB|nr:uncharacterized protein MAL13P1.304-like [Centruroides sculpturatus]